MAENTSIIIKGARVNNLKNIDVEIPRNKLVVITGLSGSGKSSLAFDTLYAEGQRRYVESLSSYARQFLGRMSKPECDFIKGIPPAIAIEQKVSSRNPRSTVGTSTEIYEYLRLLYARVGKTFSPVSGQEVKKHSAEDIVKCMLEYPEGTRYTVLAPILLREDRTLQQQLEIDMKQGFTRLEVNGEMMRIDEYKPKAGDTVFLLIDRMTASSEKDSVSRLTDSAETAMRRCLPAAFLPARREYLPLSFQHQVRSRRHHLRRTERPDVLLQLSHRCMPRMRGIRESHRHRRASRDTRPLLIRL